MSENSFARQFEKAVRDGEIVIPFTSGKTTGGDSFSINHNDSFLSLSMDYSLEGVIPVKNFTGFQAKDAILNQSSYIGGYFEGSLPFMPSDYVRHVYFGMRGNAIDQSTSRISQHISNTGDIQGLNFVENWGEGDRLSMNVFGAEHYRGSGVALVDVKASADGNSTCEAHARLWARNDSTENSGIHYAIVLAEDGTGTVGGLEAAVYTKPFEETVRGIKVTPTHVEIIHEESVKFSIPFSINDAKYADDNAAGVAGVQTDELYFRTTGELAIKL